MTVLEDIGKVRKAEKIAQNMGITIRRSVPDEGNPMADRYEAIASFGLDSKKARLAPTGSFYQMVPAPGKAIVSSLALLGVAGYASKVAYDSLMGPERDLVTASVATVGGLAAAAAILPRNIDAF